MTKDNGSKALGFNVGQKTKCTGTNMNSGDIALLIIYLVAIAGAGYWAGNCAWDFIWGRGYKKGRMDARQEIVKEGQDAFNEGFERGKNFAVENFNKKKGKS